MIERLRRHWTGLSITIFISLLPFWEVIAGRRTTAYGDVVEHGVPAATAVWRSIRDGHPPWVEPNTFSGFSMLGAGQFAVFYPPHALFGWLEATNALRWWLVLHLVVGAAGMFAWSRRRWHSTPGAIVSAASFSLCAFHVLHLVHMNWTAGMAWLPLCFLGVDLLSERWTGARAAVLVIPLGLIGLLGTPQMLWIFGIGLALYALITAPQPARHRADARVFGALLLGLGVAAIQLVPLWSFSRTSARSELSLDEAFSYSMAPRHLWNLLFPYAFGGANQAPGLSSPWRAGPYPVHEVLAYAGATVLVLAIIGAWANRRDRTVWACLSVGAVGLVIALADTTPAGDVIYRYLPFADEVRAWGRAAVLTQVTLALLAGAGARHVLHAPRRAVAPLLTSAIGVGLAAVALPHLGSMGDVLAPGSFGIIARTGPVVLLLLLCAAAMSGGQAPRAGAALLVGVVALDLVTFAHAAEWHDAGLSPSESTASFDPEGSPIFGEVYDADGGLDRWASDTEFRATSIVTETPGVNGYDPLIQREYAETVGGLSYLGYPTRADLWSDSWLLDVLRVSTLVLRADNVPKGTGWTSDGTVPGSGHVRWTRQPDLDEAYLVGAVEVAELDRIRSSLARRSSPFEALAFVEVPLDELNERGEAGVVRRSHIGRGATVEIDARRPALLVLSMAWMDGWRATVDGRAAPVVRANGVVVGIPVPEGEHVVRLRFSPPGLTAGALITLAAITLLVGVEPMLRRSRRKQDRSDLPAVEEDEPVEPVEADLLVGPHGQVEREAGERSDADEEGCEPSPSPPLRDPPS